MPQGATPGAIYHEQCQALSGRAEARLGEFARTFRFGGKIVRIICAGLAPWEVMGLALEGRRIPDTPATDLVIHVVDLASAGELLPRIDPAIAPFARKARIPGYSDDRFTTLLEETFSTVSSIDAKRGEAVYLMADATSIPYYERAAPLRGILTTFFATCGMTLAHGSAVAASGRAFLLTGKGGSGKSTTALLCLEAGFTYLADDWCLVEAGPPPRVHGLYGTAKLRPENLGRFPHLKESIKNFDRLDEEKATFYLHEIWPQALGESAEIRAVLLPTVVGGHETLFAEASQGDVWKALVPSTFAYLPGAEEASMNLLMRLVKETPRRRLLLGENLPAIPALLRRELEQV